MHLLYTVNAPIIAGLYSGLPQRIPMHLLYTVNAPSYYSWTIFRVTSAYTNASTLYGECTYGIAGLYSGVITSMHQRYTVKASIIAGLYSGLPQRIPMHLLYTVNAPIITGLYSGLPQRIPMHLLYTVNAPIIAGLYSGLPQRIPMHLLYTVNAPIIAIFRVTSAHILMRLYFIR